MWGSQVCRQDNAGHPYTVAASPVVKLYLVGKSPSDSCYFLQEAQLYLVG
jgi:hypothetical protein